MDLGLGSTSSHQFQVTAYDNMNEDNPLMKFSNIFDKDFLTVDLDKKLISFQQGEHILDKDLVIPRGFTLQVNAGTSIKLINGATYQSLCSSIYRNRG